MSIIQQTPSAIVTDPRKYLTLSYGMAGVGKTSWAAEIDGAYFLKCEEGTAGVSVYGNPVDSWETFLESCGVLVEQKKSNFKDVREVTTIVIDVYEVLWKLAGQWVCANEKFLDKGKLLTFQKIEDVIFGKGYQRVNELVLEKISKLMLAGFGVVLLSHVKERAITWAGKDYDRAGPNLPPSAQDAVVDACDAVGYFCIEEQVKKTEDGIIRSVEQGRYIYWQPTFLYRAKHRLRGFPEKVLYTYGQGWKDYKEIFEQTAIALTMEKANGK